MLFFLIMVGLYEKWIICPAHASPSSSPSYSRLHIILSLQVFVVPTYFLNGSCFTEAARRSIVRGLSKSKGPGGRAS